MTEAEINKIMQIPVSTLAKIASQPEELVLMLSLALKKGIQIGSERTLLSYNQGLKRDKEEEINEASTLGGGIVPRLVGEIKGR